jgi:protein-disulfide isomerase-like protein with CxxC motif
MADRAQVEEQLWGDLLEHLDLLSKRLNDVGITQQEMKQQWSDNNQKVDQCIAEQRLISQQVHANGQAVAQLTIRQFENDHGSVSEDSVIAHEEDHCSRMCSPTR